MRYESDQHPFQLRFWLETVFWIFHACPPTGRKGSRTAVTQVELRTGMNPFRALRVISKATNGMTLASISAWHLKTFPYQIKVSFAEKYFPLKKSQVSTFFSQRSPKILYIFWGTEEFCGKGETFLKKLRKSVTLPDLSLSFWKRNMLRPVEQQSLFIEQWFRLGAKNCERFPQGPRKRPVMTSVISPYSRALLNP